MIESLTLPSEVGVVVVGNVVGVDVWVVVGVVDGVVAVVRVVNGVVAVVDGRRPKTTPSTTPVNTIMIANDTIANFFTKNR